MTKIHSILTITLLFILTILNIQAISNFLPWYIWIIIFVWSLTSPYFTIFILTCTQVYATPENYPLTLTQLFIFTWIFFKGLYLFIPQHKFPIIKLKEYILFQPEPNFFKLHNRQFLSLIYLLIFITWYIITSIYKNDYTQVSIILRILIIVIITYFEVRRIKDLREATYFIMLSAFSAVILFWMDFLGIKMVSVDLLINKTLERGGIIRHAIGNGDFNFLASIMNISLAGSFSLFIQNQLNKKMKFILLLMILGSIPAIISTMSRAALIGILLMYPFFWMLKNTNPDNLLSSITKLIPRLSFVFILSAISIYLIIKIFYGNYLNALIQLQNSSDYITGREFIWIYAITGILENPVFGFIPHGIIGDKFFAHNIILDIGVYSGIIGILLFIITSIRPYKTRLENVNTLKLLYTYTIYSGLTLSQFTSKFFWVIWVMLTLYNHRLIKNEE
jgi:hypothetical protein